MTAPEGKSSYAVANDWNRDCTCSCCDIPRLRTTLASETCVLSNRFTFRTAPSRTESSVGMARSLRYGRQSYRRLVSSKPNEVENPWLENDFVASELKGTYRAELHSTLLKRGLTIGLEPVLKQLFKLERAVGRLLLLDDGKDVLPLVDELLELGWSVQLALRLIHDGLAHP